MGSPKIIQLINSAAKTSGDQTIAGVKTFSSSPKVPTAVKGTNSTVAASTAFVQAALADYADSAEVVKLTGNQSVSGTKTFNSSPLVPTPNADDDSKKAANTEWITNLLEADTATLNTIASGQIPSSVNPVTPDEIVTISGNQGIAGTKTFSSSPLVPNSTFTDSSTKSANTAFVKEHSDPIGSYIYFAGSSVPDHYLLCNGAAVSRTDYADLYAVIGDTYGAGDGSTTFNLPNLIDKFLEGSGTSGTEKSAGLPNITGKFRKASTSFNGANYADGAFSWSYDGASVAGAGERNGAGDMQFSASSSNTIYGNSATVQPPALTALPLIRYE